MVRQNQVFEIGEEKRHEQVADVEPVHVGVGGDHDTVVPERVDGLLDAERHHQVVQFFVLIDGGAVARKHVFRLAPEREYRLGLHVARRDDRSGCRQPFGKEDGRIPAELCVAQVTLAVPEARDFYLNAPGRFLGFFLDRTEFLAQVLVLNDLVLQRLGTLRVLVEIINNARLDFGDDPAADLGVAELVLGLALKHRRLELYRYGARHAFAHVEARIVFLVEFVDPLENALAERREVRAAVAGELAVHEREVCLAVACGVGKRKFEELGLVVADGIHRCLAHFVGEQVEQAVLRLERLLVKEELEARVEAGVVPQPAFHVFVVEREFAEQLRIGRELDKRSVVLALHVSLAL